MIKKSLISILLLTQVLFPNENHFKCNLGLNTHKLNYIYSNNSKKIKLDNKIIKTEKFYSNKHNFSIYFCKSKDKKKTYLIGTNLTYENNESYNYDFRKKVQKNQSLDDYYSTKSLSYEILSNFSQKYSKLFNKLN